MIPGFVRCIGLVVAAATFPLCTAAFAATREDAQQQVHAAVAHVRKVGVDQAIKDFARAPEWKAKGMNVVFNSMDGKVLSSSLNERLVGRDTLNLKDATGKEFVKEFVATAKGAKGEGWIDYRFVNPASQKLEDRSMFVRRIPGHESFVGIAIGK